MRYNGHNCTNCASSDTQQDFEYCYERTEFSPKTFLCNSCGNIDNIFPELSIDRIKKTRVVYQENRERLNKSDPVKIILAVIGFLTIAFSTIAFVTSFLDVLSFGIITLTGFILAYISFLIKK